MIKIEDCPVLTHSDYVLYPCKNVFNDFISYWISKKYCTIALYCFSLYEKTSMEENFPKTDDVWNSYIHYYEKYLEKLGA
jgi:hypothetical protein